MTEQEVENQLERLLEMVSTLEGRANDASKSIGNGKKLLDELANGLELKRQSDDVELSRLREDMDALKTTDKRQTDKLDDYENKFVKVERAFESLGSRLDGGQGEDWNIEKIRTTVRNSAFTGNLIKGTVGLVGLGGVGAIASVVFGLGRTPEREFTYLTSHQALQKDVHEIQLTIRSWETTVKKAEQKLVFEAPE